MHEAKLDGWRCVVAVSGGRVQVWSRRGGDYTAKLPELQILSSLGDVVLDGELVVVTEGGQADFELLSTRVNGRKRRLSAEHPVTLYVFDVLRHDGRDVWAEAWTVRGTCSTSSTYLQEIQASFGRCRIPMTARRYIKRRWPSGLRCITRAEGGEPDPMA